MTLHRLLARRIWTRRASAAPRRALATKSAAPPFPTIPTCPAPTCACAASPTLPSGFEIDRKAPLNGLIPNYAQHVLVCTGTDNWPSRIEEANGGDNLAADLRELVGPRGKFSDVRGPLHPQPHPNSRPHL